MPFHSGEGTNGIPAESVAAGGEQRFFLWLRLPLPAPLSAPGPCHLRTHKHTGLLFTKAHRDPIDIYRSYIFNVTVRCEEIHILTFISLSSCNVHSTTVIYNCDSLK